MLIRLENAHETFQRAIDVILASVRWQVALVHPDDIFVFSKSPKDHIKEDWRV